MLRKLLTITLSVVLLSSCSIMNMDEKTDDVAALSALLLTPAETPSTEGSTEGGSESGGSGSVEKVYNAYVTNSRYKGNIVSSDPCMSDANYPGSGTYVALTNDRRATVLEASKEYKNLAETVNVFETDVSKNITFNSGQGDYDVWWDKTSPGNNNCGNWTQNAASSAVLKALDSGGTFTATCENVYYVICVEQ